MVTFDTEVHFLLLLWTFAYFLFRCEPRRLPVCYVDSIPASLQRPDEFHLLPIIFPRFRPRAPPTRHLFLSRSTHMNAISSSVSWGPPPRVAVLAHLSRGVLVRGVFCFFSVF